MFDNDSKGDYFDFAFGAYTIIKSKKPEEWLYVPYYHDNTFLSKRKINDYT